MERTADYGWFAERYGWTKQQVDAQPYWYRSRLPEYAQIFDEVKAEKQEAATKK